MRLQLAAALLVVSTTAYADGSLTMRGVYYKERSTRVMQPMLDGMFEAGAHGLVTGHLLVDAITSASAGAGAVAAEPFTERRYEGGGGYAHELKGPEDTIVDVVRVGGEAKLSREPDYRSFYAGARAEGEMFQKNLTLGLGGGVSFDKLDNSGLQSSMGTPLLMCDAMTTAAACDLRTYSVFTSASQLLSPNALVGASYDVAKLTGFLSSPYRTAITGTGPASENHPHERFRQAIAISGRYYLEPSKTAFIGAYRYYWDDWDIHAHTPELRVVQEVGSTVEAAFRYRYYKQDAAFFWQEHYATMDGYLTDDPKMSPFDGHLFEATLGFLGETFDLPDRWGEMRFEGILEYIIQHNKFGNAVEAHVALTVPFEY